MALPKIQAVITADTKQAEAGFDRVERGLNDVGKAADNAGRRTDTMGATLNRTAGRSSAFGRGLQNASFQMADFATQVGAGTSASIALGQQLPQLLGGFGILGAVLGAVVAVAVPLTRAFQGMSEQGADLSQVLGVLSPLAGQLASAFQTVADVGVQMAEVIINNLDRILITAGLVAGFFAAKWVAAFVAARVATFSLAAALTTLRAALIRTGIGAVVVALGEGVYQFSRIAKAAGGFGAAIALVGEVFSEVWDRMKEGVRLVGVMFEGAGEIVEDAFSAAFSFIEREFNNRVVRPITGGLNTIIKAANAIGGNFSELDMPPLVLEDITTGGEGRGMAKITGAASELGTLLDEPLESVQKIRDLLASIKDERITLPDLLGVGSDEDGGGKKKTPLEEQTDLQIQALKDLKDQGRDTWSALGTFLQQFAGKSKAAAIAVIAINKGLAIAQAIQNTAVAYTKALIADPTGTLSARVAALGKIQVGLIAATGLAQAATAGASSGGGTSGGTTGASSAASAPAMPTQTVSINLQGDTFSRGSVEGLLEQIQSQLDRGGRLVFQ